jgi:hypothetical protein
VDKAKQNVLDGMPGTEGSGFWQRGIRNTYEGNEAWNCSIGMNFFNFLQIIQPPDAPVPGTATAPALYPSTPGGPADTLFDDAARIAAVPIACKSQVTASNVIDGTEYWGMPDFPNLDLISSYNGASEIFTSISSPIILHLVNPRLIGKDGTTIGIDGQFPYTPKHTVEGGKNIGHALGLAHGGGQGVFYTGTVLANVLDFDWPIPPPGGFVLDSTVHQQLSGHPLRIMIFGTPDIWPGPPTPAKPLRPPAGLELPA